MSDEELAAIEQRLADLGVREELDWVIPYTDDLETLLYDDVPRLLAEVRRQQAELQDCHAARRLLLNLPEEGYHV